MSTFSRAVVPSLIACFLLASGCDTGNPSGPGDDPEQSTESPCEFTDAAALDLQIGTSFYSVEDPIRAVVYEHAQPNMYEVIAEAGNCRHIVLAPPFCAPPGTYDEICTAASTCEANPGTVSAGTLTITGLSEPVVLDGEDWNEGIYRLGSSDAPPEPLSDAGDPIVASFSGGAFPAVELSTTGVAPFEPDMPTELDIPNTEELVISWADPEPDSCVELRLHGKAAHDGAPLQDLLLCVVDDTGSLTVPAEILQSFPTSADTICDQYQWCPESEIGRYRQSSAQTDAGEARMTVRSVVEFDYDLHD